MTSPLPSFDVLMELAQNNPEELEILRRILTDEIIHETSPHMRQKLEGINFKIDMERQRCKTPLQSCIKIAALMHDSFDQMRTELDALFQPLTTPLKPVSLKLLPLKPLSSTSTNPSTALISRSHLPCRHTVSTNSHSASGGNIIPFNRHL